MQIFTITDTKDLTRLDSFLLRKFPDYSRSYLSKIIRTEQVLVNNEVKKAGWKLRLSDKVSLTIDLKALETPEEIDIPIVYEDDNVVVINKPSGVISHSRGRYWHEPSVASFLKSHTKQKNNVEGAAPKTTKCFSLVVGCDSDVKNKLMSFCELVESSGDSYKVMFDSGNKDLFVTTLKKALKPGFWNEYITPNSIEFIFKKDNEEVETFTATIENAPHILSLCRQFAKSEFISLETMLSENSWYKENNLTSDHIHHLLTLPVAHRSGIVHRLDRATSGVMICAKNERSLSLLQTQFSSREVSKSYFAVTDKPLPSTEGIIDIPIARNPKKPASFMVDNNGKPSKTRFSVKKTTARGSLVELFPATGRTHQLRVHLAYLGCPIVGDTLYGGKTYPRLLLHAHTLNITLPGQSSLTKFEAPLPKEFEEYIKDNGKV